MIGGDAGEFGGERAGVCGGGGVAAAVGAERDAGVGFSVILWV